MSNGTKLTIPSNVVFEILEGEAVLLHLEGGEYFSLNGTATRIWQLIEQHGDRGSVCDAMVDEFDVEREVVERDVDQLIAELSARGLLQPTEG